MFKTKWDFGMKGGSVIGNPIPDEYSLDLDDMDLVISAEIEPVDAFINGLARPNANCQSCAVI